LNLCFPTGIIPLLLREKVFFFLPGLSIRGVKIFTPWLSVRRMSLVIRNHWSKKKKAYRILLNMELGGIYGAQGHIFKINNKVAMAK
jgi:hypothetical protein